LLYKIGTNGLTSKKLHKLLLGVWGKGACDNRVIVRNAKLSEFKLKYTGIGDVI
jgi:hypothetical protein